MGISATTATNGKKCPTTGQYQAVDLILDGAAMAKNVLWFDEC